jgi:DNA gyrase subunit A
LPTGEDRVTQVDLDEEMKSAYLDYAMSVIVGRALPDVRDGLKPVHRRILFGMNEMGLAPNRPFRKAAKLVGEIMGNFHPHGDAAIYDTLVRMAQDFNMRYLLVDGQGNFGSIDGDPPAAMRYTEVRLTPLATELLADIDKETVDFVPNYDESRSEPTVLPTRVPNLLMNGSSGIAVGMATNIPPHNLGEIVEGLVLLLENPQTLIQDLMRVIKGPDFPTAAFIYGMKGIEDAYQTGRGTLTLRARAIVEANERTDKETILITEIPYQVNKARLIEKIAELIRDRKVEGISEIRDESDREGMRIVLELKRGEIASIILNQLYKHTQLQTSFGVIMLALVDNRPQVLNLKQVLLHFLDFRREVVVRRTRYELRQAEERAHILEGLKIALENLDAVIALIRRSQSPESAKSGLVAQFALSEIQAQAILDMRLQRLTSMEREKLLTEYREVQAKIRDLKALLASEALIRAKIKEEILEVKEKYGDPRRTEILPEAGEINIEDLIAPEEMVITISHSGYIKRNPASIYRAQRRGGKGKIGMGTKEEDFVEDLFVASTLDYLLFFTDAGQVYWLKVHQIPEAGRIAKGKAIVNLLQITPTEMITAILPVAQFTEDRFVVMATQKGLVKKTELAAYSNPRAGGIRALNLEEGDRLIAARLTAGRHDIFITTRNGLIIRFHEQSVRSMGRTATGVWGIRLGDEDRVVSMEVVEPSAPSHILTVTDKGFGKRTKLSEYRTQGRGGKGVITIRTSPKNGHVISALQVSEEDEIMIMTAHGKILRTRVDAIRAIGRNTKGVRLMEMEENDHVVAVAPLAEKGEREEEETSS